MKKLKFIFLLLLTTTVLKAAEVDTVTTVSQSMNKKIKAVVIKPNGYNKKTKYPVVYLLHGHGGNYANWVDKVSGLKDLSDKYQMMVVCPDGNVSSWYFDSPILPEWKYETYVAKELVNWIDDKYSTINNATGRAITGLSMGGHGALYLAFKNQDVFGAAGSMSGGVDFRPFPKNWKISEKLGSIETNPENWEKYTVINMTDLLVNTKLKLIVDCGTEDFFYTVNENFHKKLLDQKIKHDYIVRPGAHNWPYWNNAIEYQLLFMKNFFDGK